jgi:hypothetical protein
LESNSAFRLIPGLENAVEYDASLWAQRDQMHEKRLKARLHRQAAQHGYMLVPMEEKPAG